MFRLFLFDAKVSQIEKLDDCDVIKFDKSEIKKPINLSFSSTNISVNSKEIIKIRYKLESDLIKSTFDSDFER